MSAAYLVVSPPSLDRSRGGSALVLAADGSMLRAFLTGDGKWRLPVEPAAVDPLYRRMLIAAEDRRFDWHRGVDPVAAARALLQLGLSGRIVSGASTLTMQTVRLLEPHPRSLVGKLREAAQALALERRMSKDKVLGLYLTLAPFGGNIEGVRAASLAYFGKGRAGSRRPRSVARRHSAIAGEAPPGSAS
jgi:penicillin-binding protein 1C